MRNAHSNGLFQFEVTHRNGVTLNSDSPMRRCEQLLWGRVRHHSTSLKLTKQKDRSRRLGQEVICSDLGNAEFGKVASAAPNARS